MRSNETRSADKLKHLGQRRGAHYVTCWNSQAVSISGEGTLRYALAFSALPYFEIFLVDTHDTHTHANASNATPCHTVSADPDTRACQKVTAVSPTENQGMRGLVSHEIPSGSL